MQSIGQRQTGYTLVELLIVTALIALLLSLVLSGAILTRHAAYMSKCTLQLRQLGIAFRMYLEDNDRRPLKLSDLVDIGYLDDKSLVCPADITGNYSSLRYNTHLPVPCSYFYPFGSPLRTVPEGVFWQMLMQDSAAGISACQLHGSRVKELKIDPVFEGLTLRLQVDGAVVRRQIFMERIICPDNVVRCYNINSWRLLSDLPCPFKVPVPCCE